MACIQTSKPHILPLSTTTVIKCQGYHNGEHINIPNVNKKTQVAPADTWISQQCCLHTGVYEWFLWIQIMEGQGNTKSKRYYEQQVPVCYKLPTAKDPPWVFDNVTNYTSHILVLMCLLTMSVWNWTVWCVNRVIFMYVRTVQ